VHAARKIEYLEKEDRGFTRSCETRFLYGGEGHKGLRPVHEGKVGADAFESLLARGPSGPLKFEKCSSRRAQRANSLGDNQV
jgi:hypothetical protein